MRDLISNLKKNKMRDLNLAPHFSSLHSSFCEAKTPKKAKINIFEKKFQNKLIIVFEHLDFCVVA